MSDWPDPAVEAAKKAWDCGDLIPDHPWWPTSVKSAQEALSSIKKLYDHWWSIETLDPDAYGLLQELRQHIFNEQEMSDRGYSTLKRYKEEYLDTP